MVMPKPSPRTSQPSLPRSLRLNPSERGFLLGKTGSGKSFLARRLLLAWEAAGWRIVIAGPKGDWASRFAVRGPGSVAQPRLIRQFDPKIKVAYFKVDVPGWRDVDFSRLCLDIASHKRTVFLVDDLDGVATANQTAPGMTTLWTTGRALKIPCMACHQWTTCLPRVIKGQSEWWAVFRMTDYRDIKEAAMFTGTPAMLPPDPKHPGLGGVKLPKYWWWYWHVDSDKGAVLMPPLPSEDSSHASG